jgi:hypothetical protein
MDKSPKGTSIVLVAGLVCAEVGLSAEPLRRRDPAIDPQHVEWNLPEFFHTGESPAISGTSGTSSAINVTPGDSLPTMQDYAAVTLRQLPDDSKPL